MLSALLLLKFVGMLSRPAFLGDGLNPCGGMLFGIGKGPFGGAPLRLGFEARNGSCSDSSESDEISMTWGLGLAGRDDAPEYELRCCRPESEKNPPSPDVPFRCVGEFRTLEDLPRPGESANIDVRSPD